MEFFNRVVDMYPRQSDGLLGTLHGGQRSVLDLEMFLLRNLAEFSVHFQRNFPDVSLLSARFRANVDLVVATLDASVVNGRTRQVVGDLCRCPPGESAMERDLSSLSLSDLWAAEVDRLQGFIAVQRATKLDASAAVYDACTLDWMKHSLGSFLGVEMVQGLALYARSRYVIGAVADVVGSSA
ncbi:hypothetical protein VNI00_018027 [Paramarasmius palmivorus]|uniref:Uncharacterized protein n=1 Tax=Paramarasmius palmivorus TaxID=297713 RepID=A0AAW0B1A8_9AGAR